MRAKLIACASILLPAVLSAPNAALAYDIGTCNVNLQDATGLQIGQPYSAYGFIDVAVGYYHLCGSGIGWQRMDDDPNAPNGSYGHLHLVPEDSAYWNCITTSASFPNGVFGHLSGGTCVAATNPNSIARTAVSHACDHHHRMTSQGSLIRPTSIQVLGNKNVNVIYYAPYDATWWEWANLSPGYTWTLNPPAGAHGASAAYVTCWNQTGPYSFDNLTIAGTTD